MLTLADVGARLGGQQVLSGVTLTVQPGERVAVVGPNGSGKSTVLRLIAGLEVPAEGTIAWERTVLSAPCEVLVPPERRGIAMVWQEGVLFPHLTAQENVALGVPPGAPSAVGAALESARVEHLAARGVTSLSAGERQRVGLARALAQQPRVMLLDEPLHSLDPPVRRAIMPTLRDVADAGVAMILVTNDVDEASGFSERIVVLRAGRVVQEGTMGDLYHDPVDSWLARFVGVVQGLDAAQASAFGIALPSGAGDGSVFFRPEAVAVAPEPEPTPATPVVTRVVEHAGRVEVTLALGRDVTITAVVASPTELELGDPVRAAVSRALPLTDDEDSR